MAIWLSEPEVRAALKPAELIDAMEASLAALSSGEVDQPVRTAIEIGERSFFGVMPAFARGRGILGAKLVTVLPGNAARGLDTHLAAISLFDAASGELVAVMDGRYITEARTAAVSAVSVRHMARTEARVLAILGSGVQARSHLEMLGNVRRFDEIRVWSPTEARLRAFVADAGSRVRAAPSAEEAVRGADVVVTATNATTPALFNEWVSDGTHVIAVGACRPAHQEIDAALMARARLAVDSRAAALRESGDVLLAIKAGFFDAEHASTELGEIVSGTKPGRTSPGEVTLFKSLGLAIEDLVAADTAYRRAREAGRGTAVSLR